MNDSKERLLDLTRQVASQLRITNARLEQSCRRRYQKLLSEIVEQQTRDSKPFPTRFVIFNYPRTGSNMLCSLLNQHPEILCHHEIFNPERIYYAKDFKDYFPELSDSSRQDFIRGKVGPITIGDRDRCPEQLFFIIWQQAFGAKAVGFNLFPNHIPNAAISLVEDVDVKKVLLIRRNKIRTYVSLLLARETSVWDRYGTSEASRTSQEATPMIKIPVEKFLRWSSAYEAYFQTLRLRLLKSQQPHHEIYYEDLVSPQADICKKELLGFIGVSPRTQDLLPTLKKQNTARLSDVISNYDDLKHKLAGTALEPLLNEED